jgi:hypothetical protein
MSNENKESKEKLLKLMREAVDQDNELRKKYNIGDKFRFIRDRLQASLTRLEENLTALQKETEESEEKISEDETLVYVYLYNTQGISLQTWQKLLNPAVFYEFSVNRPVYQEKIYVETFIRNKANKAQHGYLTIIIKKKDILELPAGEMTKDAFGNPIIKVREGSLSSKKMLSFTHNEHEYVLNENGELVKKKI